MKHFRILFPQLLILCVVGSAIGNTLITEQRLNSVSPALRLAFKKVAAEMNRKYPGTQLNVSDGLRSIKDQDRHRRNGKSQANGFNGYHTHGLALDLVPLDGKGNAIWNDWIYWKDLAAVIARHGFESGYHYSGVDAVHMQIPRKVYPISVVKRHREDHGAAFVLTEAANRVNKLRKGTKKTPPNSKVAGNVTSPKQKPKKPVDASPIKTKKPENVPTTSGRKTEKTSKPSGVSCATRKCVCTCRN